MKKSLFSVIAIAVVTVTALFFISTITVKAADEKAMHPRIVKAIEALDDAVAYMKAAPHDFGGHKTKAIADSEQAIRQLRLALQYRAVQDSKKK